jgi:ATP-grasp domain, R2K clade family 2
LPQWIPEELCQIEAVAAEIANCGLPRRRQPLTSRLNLRLSEGLGLVEGLGGSKRALPVRQLLRALGFDEARHLQWRMEHKLVQALVLQSSIPEIIPVTCGIDSLARRHGPRGVRQFLAEDFPGGYILKTALGDSSGEAGGGINAEAVLCGLESREAPQPGRLLDEKIVVQKRIAIATEYRVHSLEEDVIDDLTFRRYEGGSIAGERDGPNAFVMSVLRRLPDGLVGGSLLAWDIALQPSGEYTIIEINFTGFHPAFKRGFNCSGYFHDPKWGACDTARLLNHVARKDGVDVIAEPDAPEYPVDNGFYREVANWQLRHRGLAVPILHAPTDSRTDTRTEGEVAEPLIRQIDAFAGPRHRAPVDGGIELRLSNAIPLLPQLAATTRALPMRQALVALGFDERRLTSWRLEHKLVQALIFRHYCPDSLPPTLGLNRLAQGVNLRDLRSALCEKFPQGYVIKRALGDCSGNDCDHLTEATLSWIESGARYMPGAGTLTDEEFIVQERKHIRHEYRIHTIEDRVIGDLTVYRHQGSVKSDERHGPNLYVQRILDALPAGITSGSNLGWDVALLDNGSFAVIEVNIGGVHTVYNPGFHASGFFHHHRFGAIYSARLLLFLERTYHCRIAVIADSPQYSDENYFYAEVADWKKRF